MIKSAHETQITGRQSELTAIKALIDAGWEVAEPVVGEPYDLLAKNPVTDVWVQLQVKTVRKRDDRGGAAVVYATKSNGKPYSEKEVDYFVGVDGEDCYLILNRKKREYWKPVGPVNRNKESEWVLLNGEITDYPAWRIERIKKEVI